MCQSLEASNNSTNSTHPQLNPPAKSMRVSKASKIQKRPLSPLLLEISANLEKEVEHLLSTNTTKSNYAKLYKHVEFLCRERQQSKLAAMIYHKIDVSQAAEIEKLKDAMMDGTDLGLLQQFIGVFEDLETRSKSLAKIFLYLDRTYLLNHPIKKTIEMYSLDGIHIKIFEAEDSLLAEALMNATISTLNDYRESHVELKPLVSSIINKLLSISYRNIDEFETFIIEATEQFYIQFHSNILQSQDQALIFPQYYDVILREFSLWDEIESRPKLSKIIKFSTVSNLLFLNFEHDGSTYIKPLFTGKKFQELHNLFKFIAGAKTEDIKKHFLAIWGEYIIEYITTLTNDESDNIIEKLIKAKKNLHKVAIKFFDSDSAVIYKLTDAFQSAMNASQRGGKIINTRLLRHIDSFFRTNETREDDETIKDIFLIFKSIRSKEEFILSYQRDLSKRLINSTTKSIENEKKLLSLFETEVDSDEMRSLPMMIEDILKNDTLMKEFNSTHLTNTLSYEFKALVLNSQIWPKPRASINFPTELASKLTEFQSYYVSTNGKKTLQWCPLLGSMSVAAVFPKCGERELQVSTFQGLVLLQFNDQEELTFQQLTKSLQLDTRNLISVLHSLTQGKYKVLLRFKRGSETYYKVNDEFNERRKVIKIKRVQMKLKNGEDDDDDESEVVKPRIEEALTSFIVRVMKGIKIIENDVLVERVQEKFIIEKDEVLEKIEQLIRTEYIAKDGPDKYRYIP